ncbi:MAG TPA: hypothetical protein VF984_12635 [Actinomycetota bacterium]
MAGAASVDVYLEMGAKRVFAGAIEWPGWCRSGRDETEALDALDAYAPRYAEVLRGSRLGFRAPKTSNGLEITERLKGNPTTDWGAPDVAPDADGRPIDRRELARLRRILEASWGSLDRVAAAAEGAELRKGPRGGGRELDAIVAHVIGAEGAYLRRIAGTPPKVDDADPSASLDDVRRAVLDGLERAASEGVPETGPRGGKMWRPRYFVRREAWHVLDHVWEIEDRATRSA